MTIVPYRPGALQVPQGKVKPEPMTQADYEAIRNELASWSWPGAYPHLVFLKLLRASGLRIAEALRLTSDQMFREGPQVLLWILRGKKRDKAGWERLPISPVFGSELLAFIEGTGVPKGSKVFPWATPLAFQRVFGEASETALGRRVTPHQLRHLYIKWGLENGNSLEQMANMVGHADPRTTLKVYHDLTTEQRHEINLRVPV